MLSVAIEQHALAATATMADTAPEVDDEGALARRFAAGDAGAFDAIAALHRERVTRLAYRLLGWRDDEIEDVVQEVFLSVLNHLGRFRGESKLGTWLTVITINKCRTHRTRWFARWRMLRRRREHAQDETAPAADEGARRDETSARVRQAVQKLKPRDREVIVLHYLEQHDAGEMARLLGVSQNAVEVRLHRARQRLKGLLKDVAEA
jgi:RNA polymerase sigma-70 factor (ECF subfamily)